MSGGGKWPTGHDCGISPFKIKLKMKSGRFCMKLKDLIVESNVCFSLAFCCCIIEVGYIFAFLSGESKEEFYILADFNV